jgi:hypothetical protein
MKNGNGSGSGYQFGGLDEWRSDPEKCRNGVPFDLGKGRALIVRRANLYDREIQAHFATVDSKDTAAVQALFARVLVVGWVGIVDIHGEPIPYSPDACVALLNYANEIWEELNRFAMNRANYAVTQAKEDIEAVKGIRDGEPAQAPTANS